MSQFRATGKGYYNRLPGLAANSAVNTGLIQNNAMAEGERNRIIYLYITDVTTGWKLAGEFGQKQLSRVFYPHNVSQDNIIVEGQMPNQYEYDRLVEFVANHHKTALTQHRACSLKIPPGPVLKLNGVEQHKYPGFYVDGYIKTIEAGHKRFTTAPTFKFEFVVTNDNLDSRVDQSMYARSTVMGAFLRGAFQSESSVQTYFSQNGIPEDIWQSFASPDSLDR